MRAALLAALVALAGFGVVPRAALAAQAADVSAAGAPEQGVRLEVQRRGEGVEVQASFLLPLTRCQAWRLLSNHDLAARLPEVASTTLTRVDARRVRVARELRGPGPLAWVRARSVVEYIEDEPRGTDFFQIEGPLLSYTGRWRLSDAPSGTIFAYSASARAGPLTPSWLVGYVLGERLRGWLELMASQGPSYAGVECD